MPGCVSWWLEEEREERKKERKKQIRQRDMAERVERGNLDLRALLRFRMVVVVVRQSEVIQYVRSLKLRQFEVRSRRLGELMIDVLCLRRQLLILTRDPT